MDITLQRVGYTYAAGTPFQKQALHDVDVRIPDGSYTAVIGHTGSGKSTLLQHLNALLKPTEGTVRVGDTVITKETKGKQLRSVRRKVGIVFQFPEHQLFEETVLKDVMFGPLNFGIPEAEAAARAEELLGLLGLPEGTAEKSPFDLSGGQMRRVAIAGVLAMDPDVLVLDEPTAGLDPSGRREIMDLFHRLHEERDMTTILVTHSMEDAARYADHVIVMHDGTDVLEGPPEDVFGDAGRLARWRLEVPRTVAFQREFERGAGLPEGPPCLTEEQLADYLAGAVKKGGGAR
ncbi:energy-coupling factor ABC transporter ATP-binding protein [Edaphobacillus lindanitolerans]|uniref:Energy-coupling factor transporter ATP-binding protein EcfA2 n=1 Tax=Edaphobacillus lindanitolerans TaxID=550447 RepID=A0A1U7PRF2_9BACI|nr:energy-coupling factor ABC transporter ATP-binding protein [Edaphobacillus lindanitolerans]SIT87816.1 energy-coupling factor transport system ATP-binding protein [Edaphobacillus lindanitolerans]